MIILEQKDTTNTTPTFKHNIYQFKYQIIIHITTLPIYYGGTSTNSKLVFLWYMNKNCVLQTEYNVETPHVNEKRSKAQTPNPNTNKNFIAQNPNMYQQLYIIKVSIKKT